MFLEVCFQGNKHTLKQICQFFGLVEVHSLHCEGIFSKEMKTIPFFSDYDPCPN